MIVSRFRLQTAAVAVAFAVVILLGSTYRAGAQGSGPQMLHPLLDVRTVVSGLANPIGIAFLGPADMLVLEKDTGQVKRVVNGVVTGMVLDLGVNRNSERGLLGIALHPDFPSNPGVYLYWTCRSTAKASRSSTTTKRAADRADASRSRRRTGPECGRTAVLS